LKRRDKETKLSNFITKLSN